MDKFQISRRFSLTFQRELGRRNMTPNAFAVQEGLPPNTVYRLWKGTHPPTLQNALSIATRLGMTIDEMIHE